MAPRERSLEALRQPLVADRVRRIVGGFAYLPHRFLRDGFFASLGRDELTLYVFLVLAGNRDGVSFYRYDAICSALSLTLDDYVAARNVLIAQDLLAFDGTRFQVLSLPERPIAQAKKLLTSEADFEARDPATIRSAIRAALNYDE